MSKNIREIAALAGVSASTVSKVLNDKTHDLKESTVQHVRDIIKQENYVPNHLARAIVTKKTMILAVIIPDVSNPFFADIVRGAEDAAYKNNYSVIVCNTENSKEKERYYLNVSAQLQVDGIVLITNEDEKEHQILNNIKIPTVAIDRPIQSENIVSFITSDNEKGSLELAQYLASLNIENCVYVSGSLNNKISLTRYNIIQSELKRNNIKMNYSHYEDFTFETGQKFVENNLDLINDLDCIVCGNDLIAFGVITALQENGYKIPEDIYVTGYDDILFGRMSNPALTTVRQQSFRLGVMGVNTLMQHLNNQSIRKEIILKQNLVIRNSTENKGG